MEFNLWFALGTIAVVAGVCFIVVFIVTRAGSIGKAIREVTKNPILVNIESKITTMDNYIANQIGNLTNQNISLKNEKRQISNHYVISVLHSSHRKSFQDLILEIKELDCELLDFKDKVFKLSNQYLDKVKEQFEIDVDTENIENRYINKIKDELEIRKGAISIELYKLLILDGNKDAKDSFEMTVSAIDSYIYRVIKDIDKKVFQSVGV